MRFGVVILPEFPWPIAADVWRRAEELGFDHAWTYDHLAWRSFRDETWFGAIPTLTAAATATSRIRIGTLVLSPNFRHPVPLAKELVTLDDISGGRFTLGIGAGAVDGWDTTMLGQTAWSSMERSVRFAEFLELTDRLLREPEVTFSGHYYSADEARTYPGCVQQPRIPFAVAASGPRAMSLVAKYAQTWVTVGDRVRQEFLQRADGAQAVREQISRLEDVCAEQGRDPVTIDRLVLTGPLLDAGLRSVDAFRETAAAYADAGVTDLVVHWPRPTEPYAADLAIFEAIFGDMLSSR